VSDALSWVVAVFALFVGFILGVIVLSLGAVSKLSKMREHMWQFMEEYTALMEENAELKKEAERLREKRPSRQAVREEEHVE